MRRLPAILAFVAVCSVATVAVAQSDVSPRPGYGYQDRYYDRSDDDRNDYRAGPGPYRYAPPDRYQQSQRYGGGGLRIMEAWYGRNRRVCDATPALRGACDGRESCAVKAGNELCGDPTPGRVKQLTVTYRCHGQVMTTDRPEPSILGLRC